MGQTQKKPGRAGWWVDLERTSLAPLSQKPSLVTKGIISLLCICLRMGNRGRRAGGVSVSHNRYCEGIDVLWADAFRSSRKRNTYMICSEKPQDLTLCDLGQVTHLFGSVFFF